MEWTGFGSLSVDGVGFRVGRYHEDKNGVKLEDVGKNYPVVKKIEGQYFRSIDELKEAVRGLYSKEELEKIRNEEEKRMVQIENTEEKLRKIAEKRHYVGHKYGTWESVKDLQKMLRVEIKQAIKDKRLPPGTYRVNRVRGSRNDSIYITTWLKSIAVINDAIYSIMRTYNYNKNYSYSDHFDVGFYDSVSMPKYTPMWEQQKYDAFKKAEKWLKSNNIQV